MPEIMQAPPKYVQIADYIKDQILRGELRPGDEVPSERQIVELWQVSRPTATRALAALRTSGLVDARQGAGTYVREQTPLYRRARDRYARSRETGQTYTAGEWSEITAAETGAADETVADALGLSPGDPVIRRRRVVHDHFGPVEVSISWFAGGLAEVAPRLLRTERIREGTLAYVEECTGRRGAVARDSVSARLATPEEAAALGLGDAPAAVLLVRHTSYDTHGAPIEHVEAVYPPQRWSADDEYVIPS